MRFPVTEHLGNFGSPRKGTREILLAIVCLIWVCECSSNAVAKFANVAQVKATHIGIERKSPAH
jgi:hypothetical protein